MGRIVHLAMRVDDIDKTADFFAKVFGFTQVKVPGLRETVRYVTDGTVHIAINKASPGTQENEGKCDHFGICLLYTSPSPRDGLLYRMPSSA